MANRDKSRLSNGQARTSSAPVVARVVTLRRLNQPAPANSNRQSAGKWLRSNGGRLAYVVMAGCIAALMVVALLS
ncbi:hypothetical protein ACFSM5_15435 [Lacibacterium aquatile]|uniref:Uncharacterized protein n=1 Tax=Lacibacterium aquatile TaxID=1168082 RepID=A0ABW5DYJ3_9PROT